MLETKISKLIAAGLLLGSANCGGIAVIDYEPQQHDTVTEDAGSDASPDADNSCDVGLPNGYNLNNYPNMFVDSVNGNYIFNGYLVMGEKAPAIDNLTLTDIIVSMRYKDADGNYSQPVTFKDATKLDSEIHDVYAQNLISIGNSCENQVTSELLCHSADCLEGLTPSQARIRLITLKDGRASMLVTGYSGAERRIAGKVIAHRLNELSGTKVLIEGSDYSTANIIVVE